MNSVTLVAFHLLLATVAFRLADAAGCPGCSSSVSDPNSENIRDVISRTLSKTNAGYTLTNVKNCKSQVVAGMKYDCEIEIKSPSGQVSECQLSVVQRPWLKDDKEQIISETCSSVSRSKRAACPGCAYDVDANSGDMTKRLTGVLGQTNSGLTLVKGTHCTAQVVAGFKYDCTIQVESPQINGVQTCKLVFVDQPWKTPKTDVLEDTCSSLVRNKREVCAGCPVQQDADTPEMKKTLSGILSQTNSGLTLVKGKSCTTQVVAGIKYTCTMEVTSPKINGVETCKISFLEQPWISPDPQIISDSCSQLTRAKREVCDGCPVEHDPHDPKMEKMMGQALSQTNSGLGLVGVEKCTSQVVAGFLYDCTIRVNSAHFNGVETCHMKLLDQSWISNVPQVVEDTCSQLNKQA